MIPDTLERLLSTKAVRIGGVIVASIIPVIHGCETDQTDNSNIEQEPKCHSDISTTKCLCEDYYRDVDYCCKALGKIYPEYCPGILEDPDNFYFFCEQKAKDPAKREEMYNDVLSNREVSMTHCCRVITEEDPYPLCFAIMG